MFSCLLDLDQHPRSKKPRVLSYAGNDRNSRLKIVQFLRIKIRFSSIAPMPILKAGIWQLHFF